MLKVIFTLFGFLLINMAVFAAGAPTLPAYPQQAALLTRQSAAPAALSGNGGSKSRMVKRFSGKNARYNYRGTYKIKFHNPGKLR